MRRHEVERNKQRVIAFQKKNPEFDVTQIARCLSLHPKFVWKVVRGLPHSRITMKAIKQKIVKAVPLDYSLWD